MIDKIKVENLITQIQVADTIELVGECPTCVVAWDCEIKGEPENQVLLLTWADDQHQEFNVILTEQSLSNAKIVENTITCEDHEGDQTYIRLWQHQGMDIEENMKQGLNYP
jgi:C-terminal processing protease CtpA/Prc